MGLKEITVIALIVVISMVSNTCEAKEKLVKIISHHYNEKRNVPTLIDARCETNGRVIGPTTLRAFSNYMEFNVDENSVASCTFTVLGVVHDFEIFNKERGKYGENCWQITEAGPCLCECNNDKCYEDICYKYDS
uniref:Hum s 3 allergen n=1 Tax=Humulus scandens TaxID=228586 RepID=A0A6J3X053_HUMSC